jgi:hypothetical protein
MSKVKSYASKNRFEFKTGKANASATHAIETSSSAAALGGALNKGLNERGTPQFTMTNAPLITNKTNVDFVVLTATSDQ